MTNLALVSGAVKHPWATVRAGDALTLFNGRAFKPSDWSDSGKPIVRIQNLNNPNAPFNYYQGESSEKHALADGDLLFAWSGTPGTSFGAHIWRGGQAWLNQHIFKVLFDEDQFDKRFLQLAINQNLAEYVRAAHGGAGLAHITKGRFEDSQLPCPGIEVQQRIVSEIEKQFARLEVALRALGRTQTTLKRYRAAVLQAACNGRLVPTDAEVHKREPFPSGKDLVDEILSSRRKQTGRRVPNAELSDLPPIPDGWTWAAAEDLMDPDRSTTYGVIKLGRPVEHGVPVLRSSDVRSLRLDLNDVKTVAPEIAKAFKRTFLKGSEVLVTVRGTLGGVVAVPDICGGFNISREVAMFAPAMPEMAKALAILVAAPQQQRWLLQRSKGIAYTGINIETLKQLPIPLPPLAEQHRIVAEVERRLSVVEQLEQIVYASLRRAKSLRHSILQRAFSGEL